MKTEIYYCCKLQLKINMRTIRIMLYYIVSYNTNTITKHSNRRDFNISNSPVFMLAEYWWNAVNVRNVRNVGIYANV